MLKTKQVTLEEVKAENVLRYIYTLIKPYGRIGSLRRQRYVDDKAIFSDGEMVIDVYSIQEVKPPDDNKIEVNVTWIVECKGKDRLFPKGKKPFLALVFEVWQLQNDTVLLQMRFMEIGLLAHIQFSKIIEAFSKQDETSTQKISKLNPKSYIPKGIKTQIEWRAAWRKIKGDVKLGNSTYRQLADKSKRCESTVAKIVKAGIAGDLD